jgi:endoglucanase
MLSKRHQDILMEMLSLPTAPFAEEAIRQYIFNFCQHREAIKAREDSVGNILVRYGHAGAKVARPVCFCAHMDHPGFRAVRMIEPGVLKAQWHGGVGPEYFPGARLRFYSDGVCVQGKIVETNLKTLGLEHPRKMVNTVEVALQGASNGAIRPGSPGMWALPDPQIKNRQVHARACDDIAGCSAMLCCLDSLIRSKAKTECYFLFTRAEEVGFIGAIAACRLRTIPRKCLVVAIETSSVLPGVKMGGGPILRVGDKSSIFSPDLTAWCGQVAAELATKNKKFVYQRKLMDGGSCESSAYCQLGYDATGVCIALGNYHNCDVKKKKIASEFVSLDDFDNLIRWFVALVTSRRKLAPGDPRLQRRLDQLEKRYQRLLKATV